MLTSGMKMKLHFSYSSFLDHGDGTYEGDIRTLRRVGISFYIIGLPVALLGALFAFQDCFPGLLCMFMGLVFVLGHRELRQYKIYKAMEDEKALQAKKESENQVQFEKPSEMH